MQIYSKKTNWKDQTSNKKACIDLTLTLTAQTQLSRTNTHKFTYKSLFCVCCFSSITTSNSIICFLHFSILFLVFLSFSFFISPIQQIELSYCIVFHILLIFCFFFHSQSIPLHQTYLYINVFAFLSFLFFFLLLEIL